MGCRQVHSGVLSVVLVVSRLERDEVPQNRLSPSEQKFVRVTPGGAGSILHPLRCLGLRPEPWFPHQQNEDLNWLPPLGATARVQ